MSKRDIIDRSLWGLAALWLLCLVQRCGSRRGLTYP